MRLYQNQLWRRGTRHVRIVRLDRWSVDFKAGEDGADEAADHETLAKKEFCRLIKGMKLDGPEAAETPAE
jgi:hypothetical protein